MNYIALVKRLYLAVKHPDSAEAEWKALANMVAVDEFRWVNPSHEVTTWQGYIKYLTQWMQSTNWESTVHRIHQWQNTVYLEHEERCQFGDTVDIGYTLSVFEFNAVGRIQRMSVYLQHTPSLGL